MRQQIPPDHFPSSTPTLHHPRPLLPPDHFARVVAMVKRLDLSEFYADIKAREGHVGRSAVDPAILIVLIVLATVEGVASDRQIARNFEPRPMHRSLRGAC